jgi:hypothetical protein
VQWPDAVEIDRVVPASGNMSIGPQQFWLGPGRTGQQVRFWIDTTTVHLSIGGWRIKTVPSRLSTSPGCGKPVPPQQDRPRRTRGAQTPCGGRGLVVQGTS